MVDTFQQQAHDCQPVLLHPKKLDEGTPALLQEDMGKDLGERSLQCEDS